MRLVLGALLAAALFGCRRTAPSGFTLLFLGRSPAASLGGLSWAPDPEHARLVGFDRELRVARVISSPRLATPMAVAPLTGSELLVTEHTGEGVVIDTAGRPVREWPSPDIASLYAAGGGRVAATRSPYYVPQLGAPWSLQIARGSGTPGSAGQHVPRRPDRLQATQPPWQATLQQT